MQNLIDKAMKSQSGFTLIELVITVFIVGAISIVLSPIFNTLVTSQRGAYSAVQKVNNQNIATGLINYARYNSTQGFLPNPYTGGGLTNAVYDPANSTAAGLALSAALTQTGINSREINDDGYENGRVRVYQLVSGLTQTVPLYFQSGPTVTLTYQHGVIYQTACNLSDSTCNPHSSTGVPGDSVKMTTSNFATWAMSGSDIGAVFVSSLPVQKQMMSSTAQKLDKIRDSLVSYLRAQQSQAAATDTTNWYPSESISLGGATPGTNQGCRDGWYNLSSSAVVLPTVGLTASEYGTTAWGGQIQYCRDYDPTGAKAANAAPHFGALRINKLLSSGVAPDAVTISNNIVLSF